jgi:hypothetical protein
VTELDSIFPARCEWPSAIDDLASAPADAERIRLVSGAKNFHRLAELPTLKALWCFDINEKAFEALTRCASLEALYIDHLKVADLGRLQQLPTLKILSLERCSKVSSLDQIAKLGSLEGLAITHVAKVDDLSPLSAMRSLRALGVSGSMWTRMKVKSLSPFAELKNLELLDMSNSKADDGSLQPLAGLTRLRHLGLSNFYSVREFARLSQALPSTECTWFSPVVEIQGIQCKVCKGTSKVLLAGRGTLSLCRRCDADRLDKHLREWAAEITAAESR